MARPISTRLATLAIAVLPLLAVTASPAHAQQKTWTRTLSVDLSARELGLPAGASTTRLARAALRRYAERLGVDTGLRLASRQRSPARDGAASLEDLRFQQTAGPARVLWSQLDVEVADGDVTSIRATVVPVKAGAAQGQRRVSRDRALTIARRAVPGSVDALSPLPVAFAGTPTIDRNAKSRVARAAWVVEVRPDSASREEAGANLCVVVDAQTGKVLDRWEGMADRPDRGPDARGAGSARASQAPSRSMATVYNGLGLPFPYAGAPVYSNFIVVGNPRDAYWPQWFEALVPSAARSNVMDALSANARNVARNVCDRRGYCSRRGGFFDLSSHYDAWRVWAVPRGDGSSAFRSSLDVRIDQNDIMGLDDPNRPANDVVAHEYGHVQYWVYAGDLATSTVETDSVEEAIADMIAYDDDHLDPTIGEESVGGPYRNLANPGLLPGVGRPHPSHMTQFLATAPSGHFNSTILSHAYYLFVQKRGHHQAGRVVQSVPEVLSPRPTFREFAQTVVSRAVRWYPQDGPDAGTLSDVAEAAQASFSQVGLSTTVPRSV